MFALKRLYAVLTFALLVSSLIWMGMGPAAAKQIDIVYRVDLSNPESGRVGVSVELDSSQQVVLQMEDSYGDLATGLASHVTSEAAMDANGQGLPVRRDGNNWYVEGSGRIRFSYQVDPSGYRAGTDYLNSLAESGVPWPYFPHLARDLSYLPGYAIFVHPLPQTDYQPSLDLIMPSGWQEALPWSDQPSSMAQLMSNPLFAGDLVLVEQSSLLVAAPSSSAAAAANGLSEYAGKAQILLSEAEGQLGGMDLAKGQKAVLALLFRGDVAQANEMYYPSRPFSSCIALPSVLAEDPLSDANIEATSRGMVDLLLAEKIDLAAEALWLREGTAWYFQDLIPYQSGLWGSRAFWDRFNRNYDVYRAARGGFSGSIATSGSMASSSEDGSKMLLAGGASACAALDSALHDAQPFSGDLAAFLRNLISIEGNSISVGNEAIQSTLESLTGRDWSGFFDDYINGTKEIPASSFSSLNVAQPKEEPADSRVPNASTSVAGWIILGIALGLVFIIPFVLEPYTMRPRKPGFLQKKLGDDEEKGSGLLKKWWAEDEDDDDS